MKTTSIFSLLALLGTVAMSQLSNAEVPSATQASQTQAAASSAVLITTSGKCESVASIKARATDEICDYFVDASEDCFALLNEKFTALKARADSKPLPKDLIDEAQKISSDYMTAISSLEIYRKNMGLKICGDQRERVRVMIEETRTDLKDLSALISNTKMRK